jgi:SAM-dependent methyltransferase
MPIMKPSNCPLCHQATQFEHKDTYQDPGGLKYDLYACKTCDAWFWEPLKNPGGEWYAHDPRYADRNSDPILEPNWNHKKIISFLAPFTGSVLDVGCGVGNFLAWARSSGWETQGIDFDKDAIEAGKRTFGLERMEVASITDFAARNQNKTFDLVTAFDVFEHIDNHDEFIATIKKLLVPRGYVAMSMPYRKRAAWLMPGDWPPRHLTRWDRHSIKRYLEGQGLEVLYLNRKTEGLRFIILKFRFMFGKYLSFGMVKKVKDSVKSSDGRAAAGSARTRVKLMEALAKTKDAVIFGIPAFFVWLAMLPTSYKYVTLYVIARKRD